MTRLEKRIKALEDMITEIHAVMVQGKKPSPPGVEECRRAIEASQDAGNIAALESYLKRGGKIYPVDEVYPEG